MKQQEQGKAADLEQAQQSYAVAMQEIQAQLQPGNPDPQAIATLFQAANDAVERIVLASGSAGAAQALAGVESNYSQLANGIDGLSAGLGQLDAGKELFAGGLSDFSGGVGALSLGTRDLANGGKVLNTGAITLADSVKDIDTQILDELQGVINEKLGAGYKAHSFVVPSNTNVLQVQFVYVVEGVSADDENVNDDTDESEGEDKSFIDRLLALFS